MLLVIDNFNEVMANEWTILQNLKLPIAPVSTLNELYSRSTYTQASSVSTVVVTNAQDQDVVQEYTTLGNNSKHLRTLGQQIEFPLSLVKNHNKIGHCEELEMLRGFVNQYI